MNVIYLYMCKLKAPSQKSNYLSFTSFRKYKIVFKFSAVYIYVRTNSSLHAICHYCPIWCFFPHTHTRHRGRGIEFMRRIVINNNIYYCHRFYTSPFPSIEFAAWLQSCMLHTRTHVWDFCGSDANRRNTLCVVRARHVTLHSVVGYAYYSVICARAICTTSFGCECMRKIRNPFERALRADSLSSNCFGFHCTWVWIKCLWMLNIRVYI